MSLNNWESKTQYNTYKYRSNHMMRVAHQLSSFLIREENGQTSYLLRCVKEGLVEQISERYHTQEVGAIRMH